MHNHRSRFFLSIILSAATLLPWSAGAQAHLLNLYSARHYATDEALYANFTAATGIQIRRVDADDAGILARLKAEGNASPADVILLVDAARLTKGEAEGLFKPVISKVLDTAIPAKYRAKTAPEGTAWYGFSSRARVIIYDKTQVKPSDVATYESLAAPYNKGKICVRSGSHPYNLSLFSAMMEHLGEAGTQAWLQGIVNNMARPPRGGDVDQIKGVASGECQIALVNTYYLARLMRSEHPDEKALTEKIGVVFPNQASWGTHLNVAGGAVARHSKNQAAAVKFLEYLASPQAQAYFAEGNNEWPIAQGSKANNPALTAMAGAGFKAEALPLASVSANQVKVQQMLDRVGFK